MITKKGAITHIVHMMQREDMEIYAESLFASQSSAEVSALSVIRKVYDLRNAELNGIFRNHFDLGNDFKVEVHDRNRKGRSTLVGHRLMAPKLQKRKTELLLNLKCAQQTNRRGHSDGNRRLVLPAPVETENHHISRSSTTYSTSKNEWIECADSARGGVTDYGMNDGELELNVELTTEVELADIAMAIQEVEEVCIDNEE